MQLPNEQQQGTKRATDDPSEDAKRAKLRLLEELLATSEDRCAAMEIMGKALNRQAYELAIGTREHTKALPALNAFMSSAPPETNTARLPPYTPTRPSLLGTSPALQSPLPPPYTPIVPTPPHTLRRSTSAPAAVPSSGRILFRDGVPTTAAPVVAVAPPSSAHNAPALPELRTFLHHLTADVSHKSTSSTTKKSALIDAIMWDAVHARHLSTNSPLRTAGSVLIYDATSSRNAVDVAAATAGAPSFKKTRSLLRHAFAPLTLPPAWELHDLIVVADNNQVRCFAIRMKCKISHVYLICVTRRERTTTWRATRSSRR